MEQLRADVIGWAEGVKARRSPDWEGLPDLDLYMDQVIAFMERHLDVMQGGAEKLITPAMINNYVKQGLIPPPVKKKYSREHISSLMEICILKQVLPIQTIADLIRGGTISSNAEAFYSLFGQEQDRALSDVAGLVGLDVGDMPDERLEQELHLLALKLAVSANASKLAAQRILELLEQRNAPKDGAAKKKK